MDFFSVYYKQYFLGCKFKEFKKFNAHPERILAILSSDQVKKAHLFIENQRKLAKKRVQSSLTSMKPGQNNV